SDLETIWCFGPATRVLASGGSELSLWDPAGGRLLAVLPQEDWVDALAFDPACKIVAAGHDDGSVSLWDIKTRHQLHDLEAQRPRRPGQRPGLQSRRQPAGLRRLR